MVRMRVQQCGGQGGTQRLRLVPGAPCDILENLYAAHRDHLFWGLRVGQASVHQHSLDFAPKREAHLMHYILNKSSTRVIWR